MLRLVRRGGARNAGRLVENQGFYFRSRTLIGVFLCVSCVRSGMEGSRVIAAEAREAVNLTYREHFGLWLLAVDHRGAVVARAVDEHPVIFLCVRHCGARVVVV